MLRSSSSSPPPEIVGLVIFGAADFFGAGVLALVELLEVDGDAAGSGVDTIGAVGVFDAGFN